MTTIATTFTPPAGASAPALTDDAHVNASTTTAPATAPAARPATMAPRAEGPAQAEAGASELKIPEWVKDAVFYQVFPDRFANGDMGNDPRGTQTWGSRPENEGMMGGDLQGVTQRMGYLKSLGVNALYLNPIFTAPSNHKYNTADYEHVDEDFGGDAAFKDMVDVAHRNGVKVMLDGVLNHVSHQHKWFRDVREKGPKSEFFDRFSVHNHPISYTRDADGVLRSNDYKSWWNYATLPELKVDNPKVREYFLTGKDAIVKKWLRDGKIDGWRMDVADDTNFTPDYWRTARREIKATNPDAYMVAENWKDAGSMLQGDQFDGTMNYQYFTFPSIEFFGEKKISTDAFVKRLENGYSTEAKHGAFNILGSHDTARFVTQAGGDWYRQRPAAIFQMTYIGAPVIYYGDELGMAGGKDPDSRRGMEWDNVPVNRTKPADAHTYQPTATVTDAANGVALTRKAQAEQVFTLYQRLIATRNAEPALRRGEFQVLSTHNDDSTLAYRRHVAGNDRDAIVAINNNVVTKDIVVPVGDVAKDGTRFTDSLSGRSYEVAQGKLTLNDIDGNFGAVLLRDA